MQEDTKIVATPKPVGVGPIVTPGEGDVQQSMQSMTEASAARLGAKLAGEYEGDKISIVEEPVEKGSGDSGVKRNGVEQWASCNEIPACAEQVEVSLPPRPRQRPVPRPREGACKHWHSY